MRQAVIILVLFVLSGCENTQAHTVAVLESKTQCLPSGTEAEVNQALSKKAPVVVLCPSSVFLIGSPIILSKPGQRLTTLQDNSHDWQPAKIVVNGDDQATAIYSRSSAIELDHLYIDGMRRKKGRLQKGGALIEIGGSNVDSLHVHDIHAMDPRGWSIIHLFEGDKSCSGAVVEDNILGPAGSPNGEWADGISVACKNSIVRRNLVEDASDGGIVVFGAPGTVVENNTILTKHNILLGGINLVDFAPFDGNYEGTIVQNNRVIGVGGFIKIGIAVGPSVWGADNTSFIHGVTVRGNTVSGSSVGYAIAIDGARDLFVEDNIVTAKFAGKLGGKCYKNYSYPSSSFIVNPDRVTGVVQQGFARTAIRYAICIQPEH